MTPPIAVQLYTLREQVESLGMRPVLERVAATGYLGVETAGFGDLAPGEFAAVCRDLDLEIVSSHVMFGTPDETAAVLDTHAELGIRRLVQPVAWPDDFATIDAVTALADQLSAVSVAAAERGIAIGYHNHFWEFGDLDGRPALAVLFDLADPAVFAEVDIYWTTVGGLDVASFLRDLGDRPQLLHVKDGPATDHDAAMTAVGSGTLDMPALLTATPAAAWHLVELDRCDTDMFEAVERSYEYLVGHGLSRGRG